MKEIYIIIRMKQNGKYHIRIGGINNPIDVDGVPNIMLAFMKVDELVRKKNQINLIWMIS